MKTLKKMINQYMVVVTVIVIGIIIVVAYFAHMMEAQLSAREGAKIVFTQIEQLLKDNEKDLEKVQQNYKDTCLKSAETIAYIVENEPSVLEDIEELKKIAEFVEVDEIHFFDETGRIFTGTHPEYYEMTMDAGEQIGFFKPMLENQELKLVQDITPNTAEAKQMQYSAVWSEGHKFIVQVGMEPINVMQVMKKNELSYIFSMLKVNVGVDFYAINVRTGEVVGATATETVGKNLVDIGLAKDKIDRFGTGFHAMVNGEKSYCVFTKMGDNWIGRTVSNTVMYGSIPANLAGLMLCCVIVGIIQVLAVTLYMNHYVIRGIYTVNEQLSSIAKGNMDECVDVKTSKEFSELSNYINEMVNSLLDNNRKMSYVLSKTNMYIGIYEYNKYMPKVRITEDIPMILGLDARTADNLAADYTLFREFINRIRRRPVTGEEDVYQLSDEVERYLRIEEITGKNEVFGVIIDVTEQVSKRRQIEMERDIDPLTGLYNRRGLEIKLAKLFEKPGKLGYGALIMLDADGLKTINDKYGHEEGDLYLQAIAGAIGHFGSYGHIAARQGGDEYVIFLYAYDREAEVLKDIQGLGAIQNNKTVCLREDVEVPLRFSFGYTLIEGRADYWEMLKEADDKMYKDKRARKELVAMLKNNL